ncbi:hypothetical protein NDU88_001787 [Pleurodeles waltl]|uniref:Uncharacterized protein n=1 Tax=Pleurodeles waltl TaxID=8319 RepID=A0AAV7WML7_PLEWA|nr:hypothetical protein NDU88_001787 [Pleurodeles waltl]
MIASSGWAVGKLAAAVFSARVLGLDTVTFSGFLQMGRWAGPLVDSLRLGWLRVAEAHPLLPGSCFLQ